MIKRGATNLAVLALGTALALASFEGAVRLVFPTFDRSGQFDFTYTVAGNLVLGQPGAVARQQKNTGDFDVIVLAANLLGDALRDVLDPRLQT